VGAPTTFIDAGTYAGASSDFSLNQRVTSRVSAHAGYGFYWNNVQYVQGPSGYSGQTGRAGVSVALAQNLNVHTTYTYTKSESDSLNAWDGHAVNFGLDFGQAISLSRNSSMGFGIGVAGVKDSSARSRYYATGFANYSYDIGRSWAFSAGYFRSVDFFQVLAQPVFLDAGTAQIGGALGRRVSLNTSVGIVSGLIGLQDPAPRYVALSGTVSAQVGLTKQLAIGAHYSLYSYQIDETALLPIGMLSRFDRQSVALSLDVWLPLISGSRRLNASR
jgi:hypothetical protein